ncbi:hypothetical protein Tco_0059291 [Tanacetum coccineum]
MAERLQSKEREELTDEEKAKLFMELMEKRRKHFAALRAQKKRETMTSYQGTKENSNVAERRCLEEKRAGKEQQKESSKKQKVEEEKESKEVEEDDEVTKKALLHKEGMMLQGIDREDLRIVKAKHGDTRPENEFKRVLYGDLKLMLEPDIKSDIWRMLQGYRVTIWKLIDSSGVTL